MKHSTKIHVLVWGDPSRGFTGRTLAHEPVSAADRSLGGVLTQLKKYLTWAARRGEWDPPASLEDCQLAFVEAQVRPEYRNERGTFPCDQRIQLRVPLAHGRTEHGSRACFFPTLQFSFECAPDDALETLAQEAVQQCLGGLTPREMLARLPSQPFQLTSVMVATKRAKQGPSNPRAPQLSAVAESLADRALRRRFPRAWQRDELIAQLAGSLERPGTNLLLLGETGVGKSSVLIDAARYLARQARRKDEQQNPVPKPQFWLTSGARLIAGMQYLGQWEQRCEQVIQELAELHGVLCVENLLELVQRGGGEPSNSLAAFFLPYLQRGELRLVAESTPAELEACRRLMPGLAELFQIVRIDELDESASRRVLEQLIETESRNQHIEAATGIVDVTYRMFKRFLPYRPMPGPPVRFLLRLWEQAAARRETPITMQRVLDQFTTETGLPDWLLRDDVLRRHDEIVRELQTRVIGQPVACEAAAQVVTAFKAGLHDPHRPLGVLLFCGPTGVGKTELAKTLARYLFGAQQRQDHFVRLDMSEYSSWGAADRLLMRPDGEPSQLVSRLRTQPFSVVLFDEIEKAAPEVFDVLLSLLDEGRLTDRWGRTTTFRSAVVILTSNLGAERRDPAGFDSTVPIPYERAVQSFFRPELFNRLDAVVSFQPLSAESIRAITRKELGELAVREGFARSNLRLTWDEAIEQRLARDGFDPRFGARPLQRTLERLIVTPIARWLVEHPNTVDTTLRLSLDTSGTVVIERME